LTGGGVGAGGSRAALEGISWEQNELGRTEWGWNGVSPKKFNREKLREEGVNEKINQKRKNGSGMAPKMVEKKGKSRVAREWRYFGVSK
jgi:hypothetical protein